MFSLLSLLLEVETGFVNVPDLKVFFMWDRLSVELPFLSKGFGILLVDRKNIPVRVNSLMNFFVSRLFVSQRRQAIEILFFRH